MRAYFPLPRTADMNTPRMQRTMNTIKDILMVRTRSAAGDSSSDMAPRVIPITTLTVPMLADWP